MVGAPPGAPVGAGGVDISHRRPRRFPGARGPEGLGAARHSGERPRWFSPASVAGAQDAASSVRCRAAGNHLVTTASAAMGLNEPGRIKTRDAGPEVHPTPERRRFSAPVVVNTDAVVNDYLEQRPQTLLLTDRLLLN